MITQLKSMQKYVKYN